MNIHIFNPEHDIALAYNNKYFTPPHAGRCLRADMGFFPALWADDGDIVMVDDALFAANKARHYGSIAHNVKFVEFNNLMQYIHNFNSPDKVFAWGWDEAVKHRFIKAGFPSSFLPDDESLSEIRRISNRKWSASILSELTNKLNSRCPLPFDNMFIGESMYVETIAELEFMANRYGSSVIKAPWSSSGRGIRYVNGNISSQIKTWAKGVLRQQSGIVIEPYYEKVKDFGMEFTFYDNGIMKYEGLSLFNTFNGAYVGNVIATEKEKQEMLSKYVSVQTLHDMSKTICEILKDKLKDIYKGHLGIDMMIIAGKNGEGFSIAPCVEINFRRTMGHVALALTPKEEGMKRLMRIGYEGRNYHLRFTNM